MKKGEHRETGVRRIENDNVRALEESTEGRHKDISLLRDYLARTGMHEDDFARRIGYSGVTLRFFLRDMYHSIAGKDSRIRAAIHSFIQTHPVLPPTEILGDLYETANVRTIRDTFAKLLPRPVAYMIYAPPGSQKSFVLQYLIAELNRAELCKNGHGRRAYYVYSRQNLRPRDLLRRVAVACGVPYGNEIDRMISNLRFEFQNRRVLLVVDEAQHLSIECLEILRELLDQPPNFSLLLAGSHDLNRTFDTFAANLEQWNSRILAKVKLPGLLEQEARGIIEREVGNLLSTLPEQRAHKQIETLVTKATSRDSFDQDRAYINVRTLTNALDQIKAVAKEAE